MSASASASSTESTSSKGAAIVTGAAQGIGRAVAIRLARDGYDVALNDLRGKEEALQAVMKEISSIGRKTISIVVDVTDEEGVIEMVKRTVDELGVLRVMVANAGIGLTFGTEFMDLRVEDLETVLKVNLIGVFLCYREAARQMVKQGSWGRIIGASSVLGRRGMARSAGYSASKFGIIGITHSLAAEMMEHGITVNAYAPGLIDTPMARGYSGEPDMSNEEQGEQLSDKVTSVTGFKEVPKGYPDDIANVVSYVASKEANFMTGQTLSINGGAYFG